MKQLIEEYKKGRVILFVGAGVSANLGIPTWSKLIDKIAEDLDYDSEVFNLSSTRSNTFCSSSEDLLSFLEGWF